MKKVFGLSFLLFLVFCNIGFAKNRSLQYACGPLKFSETAVKHFHEYLSFKMKRISQTEGTEPPTLPHWAVNHVDEYGMIFVVNGGFNDQGFAIYNYRGMRPQDYPVTMGIPSEGKIFATHNRIRWCKMKKKISRKINLEELKSLLKELDFYDGD
jgi:hypothetical protein